MNEQTKAFDLSDRDFDIRLNCTYDEMGDVLYMFLDQQKQSDLSVMTKSGLVLRTSEDKPWGVTIVDFRHHWRERLDELSAEIAAFLGPNEEEGARWVKKRLLRSNAYWNFKPCPFCGHRISEDLIDCFYGTGMFWRPDPEPLHFIEYMNRREAAVHPEAQPVLHIECNTTEGGCGAQIEGNTGEEVLAKWNRRVHENNDCK